MKRAIVLSTLFVLLTSPWAHLLARDAGSSVPANSLPTLDDGDDDEAFFSGGSNTALTLAPAAVGPVPKVDVVATCQSVLTDNPSAYAKRFYDACRHIVAQKPTRQASKSRDEQVTR